MARRPTTSAYPWLLRGAGLLLLAFVLAACQSTDNLLPEDLDAEALLEATHFVDRDMRVLFLPPIGRAHPKVDSVQDLAMEVLIFNVDSRGQHASGPSLGPAMSTANRAITWQRNHYTAVWDVRKTADNHKTTAYLRLEFRLPGHGSSPLCNTPSDACLGYLDVKLEKSKSHKGFVSWDVADVEFQGAHVPRGFVRVSNKGKLTISFKVLPPTTTAPPATIAELTTLSGAGSFDEQAGNCAASEFARPGQGLQAVGAGLQAVGAVGGMFVGDSSDFRGSVTSPSVVASQLWSGLGLKKFDDSVALLVVDDFGGVFDLPHTLFGGGSIDLQALVDQGKLSHGALVLHHVLALADQALHGFSTFSGRNPRIDGDPYFKFHDRKGHFLMVQAVDVGGLDTDRVAERIRAALSFIGGNGGIGIKQIVVNMSFAIVPCAVVDDVGATVGSTSAIPNFEAYLAALASANGIGQEYLDELGALVSTPVSLEDEALFAYLACPLPAGSGSHARCDGKGSGKYAKPSVTSIVHVASSGNFGNEYALYPAAWPSVVSVGSLDVVGRGYSAERSSFSNAATVLTPGNAYSLVDRRGRTVAYAGTSFSAPVVSLFSALDQMLRTTQCAPGSLSGPTARPPALAGSTLGEYPLVRPFSSGGSPTALGTLCNAR